MTDQNWHPGKLLEISGFFWKTCTLHAAIKLNLFTAIGDGRLSADQVAQKIGVNTEALLRLLDALVAMQLLIKDGQNYVNNPSAAKFLCKDSPTYIGYMIMHHHHLVDSWRRLDEAVGNGMPVRTRASFSDEKVREAFLMGMFNNSSLLAPQLVKQIDLSKHKRMLDLGGGPGTYAIFFCKAYPTLKATVYDLPTSRPFAEKTIKQFGMSEQVNFAGGDFVEEELSGQYDFVWLSHILHGEGPQTCQQIIAKTYEVLETGGMIGIHEFILDNDRTGPLFPALFSLNMLLETDAGRSYTENELQTMLTHAGFQKVTRLPYQGPTESGIMTALK